MNKRYFLFMYPFEQDVRSLLSLAVFALNPDEKWPAHVTVAGPFTNRPRAVARFEGKVPAFCVGLGNFFPQGLDTVYLNIGVRNLWKIWRKPDFVGDPVPHLSLYNGRNRDFAQRVFSALNDIRPYFSFSATGLSLVTSVPGQSVMSLREQIDVKLIPETSALTIDQIRSLNEDDRLQIAKSALVRCKELRGYRTPEEGIIKKSSTSPTFSGIRFGL